MTPGEVRWVLDQPRLRGCLAPLNPGWRGPWENCVPERGPEPTEVSHGLDTLGVAPVAPRPQAGSPVSATTTPLRSPHRSPTPTAPLTLCSRPSPRPPEQAGAQVHSPWGGKAPRTWRPALWP